MTLQYHNLKHMIHTLALEAETDGFVLKSRFTTPTLPSAVRQYLLEKPHTYV